ncbi:MAG: peptide chain release factor H [Flavobacterium sp.]|uniref:peptide chain release factor H n=1 Tax=Flavobacterium sp. TaxID=239 RepID=UPI00120E3F5C|nr:peptide chain release factor H [Flavobacterium sp.]RZJ65336.1 MAG: peptide chain release factor H [Flavobacterium sp.]
MEKFLQITSGRGPAECSWVVAQVLKQMMLEAEAQELHAEMLHRQPGIENGTVESASVKVSGENVDAFAESWIGSVQWIGQSQFRKLHKRKNWFVGVFEIDAAKMGVVSPKDIRYQAMRSSGAGGQHVNKVSSAVRAIHSPTGISVVSQDSRSQHQNKKTATERLLQKLESESVKRFREQISKEWDNQLNVQRGNPVRTFSGSDFKNKPPTKSYKSERSRLKNNLRNENY